MTATEIETTPQTQTGSGSGNPDEDHAHLVRCTHPEHATVAECIAAAYANALTLEALCGYKWVPTRAPLGFPVCPTCKTAAENIRRIPGL